MRLLPASNTHRPVSACHKLAGLPGKFGLVRNESGTAAVEFGLILLPFLMLLMAILECALLLFAKEALQTAADSSARLIMTGQVQTNGWGAAQFQNYVCANLNAMFNCANQLYIDVRSFSNFTSVNLPSVTNQDGTLTGNYVYQPGNPGDVVVARLIYQWPIIGTALGIGLVSSANNTNTLVATAAFRNEP